MNQGQCATRNTLSNALHSHNIGFNLRFLGILVSTSENTSFYKCKTN